MIRSQTFYDWLTRELASSQVTLIGLYEIRDRLLYVEAPALRRKYMETIGIYEEPVLRAEQETSLLVRKTELIQIALNRREPVDFEAIDQLLEQERQAQILELENADTTLSELPELSEEQAREMQSNYRQITGSFHPALNPSVTETEKELYQKAAEAYKMQDADAVRLIHDLLFPPETPPVVVIDKARRTEEEKRSDYSAIASAFATDYHLAAKLYASFAPLEEDLIIRDKLNEYKCCRSELEEEIKKIRSGFPFNAAQTLNDRMKTEEYLAELRVRALRCEREKEALESRIQSMTEDAGND